MSLFVREKQAKIKKALSDLEAGIELDNFQSQYAEKITKMKEKLNTDSKEFDDKFNAMQKETADKLNAMQKEYNEKMQEPISEFYKFKDEFYKGIIVKIELPESFKEKLNFVKKGDKYILTLTGNEQKILGEDKNLIGIVKEENAEKKNEDNG